MLAALPNQYVAVVELPPSISDEMYRSNAPPIIGRQLAVIGATAGVHDLVDGSTQSLPVDVIFNPAGRRERVKSVLLAQLDPSVPLPIS